MGFYYEKVLRPVLFQSDPEKAHDIGVSVLDLLEPQDQLAFLDSLVHMV